LLRRAGAAPLLHTRLEVESEHAGKMRFDPRPRRPLVQLVVPRHGRGLAHLQLGGDQEQADERGPCFALNGYTNGLRLVRVV